MRVASAHAVDPTAIGFFASELRVAKMASVVAGAVAAIGLGCLLSELLEGRVCPRSFAQRLDVAPRPTATVALALTAVPRYVLCALGGLSAAPLIVVARFVLRQSPTEVEATYTHPIIRLFQTFDGFVLGMLGFGVLQAARMLFPAGAAISGCVFLCFAALLLTGAVWGTVMGPEADPLRSSTKARGLPTAAVGR